MEFKLKKKSRPGRTSEQLWRHYQVEKALATKLKNAETRKDRAELYRTMYENLFKEVRDHPRLKSSRGDSIDLRSMSSKSSFVEPFVSKSATIVEFGPGDCKFLISLCGSVKKAYGIDISDQRSPLENVPPNFELIIYDGYDPKIEDSSADVVFSDQLIEHIHPDEAADHFRLVRRILRPGGRYIFRTPHRFSGPHDVSGFFSDEAEGFHLREWTYIELEKIVAGAGYSRWESYWCAKGILVKVPFRLVCFLETLLSFLPRRSKRIATRLFLPSITAAAIN